MRTPICDFVEKYAECGKMRLHMPGHKGVSLFGAEKWDITEVEGADVLYSADGIISESERNATLLFGSGRTLYSTEGSSLCIRAMVHLLSLEAKQKGRKPIVWAARNAHKAFVSAVALTDMDVKWIFPTKPDSLICCDISADRLDAMLSHEKDLPIAVYITSPDYLGHVSDVEGIANVCHKHRVLLAVDNAHGAYMRFLSDSRHPMDLGADICCDSAHKTLPTLTGGAYLHISKDAPKTFFDMAEQAMSLFASTSPSYLILQSLDKTNEYIANGYRERLNAAVDSLNGLKRSICENGYTLEGDEPMKLTVSAKSYGYLGVELAEILRESGIECEFADPDFTVMMFTPEIRHADIDKLEGILLRIPRRAAIECPPVTVGIPEKAMGIRNATMRPSRLLPVREAAGGILASVSVSCPPAIPVLVCGEIIDDRAVECFEYYGIESVRVIVI